MDHSSQVSTSQSIGPTTRNEGREQPPCQTSSRRLNETNVQETPSVGEEMKTTEDSVRKGTGLSMSTTAMLPRPSNRIYSSTHTVPLLLVKRSQDENCCPLQNSSKKIRSRTPSPGSAIMEKPSAIHAANKPDQLLCSGRDWYNPAVEAYTNQKDEEYHRSPGVPKIVDNRMKGFNTKQDSQRVPPDPLGKSAERKLAADEQRLTLEPLLPTESGGPITLSATPDNQTEEIIPPNAANSVVPVRVDVQKSITKAPSSQDLNMNPDTINGLLSTPALKDTIVGEKSPTGRAADDDNAKCSARRSDPICKSVMLPLAVDEQKLDVSISSSQKRRRVSLHADIAMSPAKRARPNVGESVSLISAPIVDNLSTGCVVPAAINDGDVEARSIADIPTGTTNENQPAPLPLVAGWDDEGVVNFADTECGPQVNLRGEQGSSDQQENGNNSPANLGTVAQESKQAVKPKSEACAPKVKVGLGNLTYYPPCNSTYDSIFGYSEPGRCSKTHKLPQRRRSKKPQQNLPSIKQPAAEIPASSNIAHRTRSQRAKRASILSE